ncbi:DsbA family protein [Vibrio makurazakiensis]|uniref:disulfide bond formation protein DsbA n=1 Tax=Vibrio makurazakiensis TaxID=2910250 RepID=UPI003D1107DC
MKFTQQVHLSVFGYLALMSVLTIVGFKHMPKAFADSEFVNGVHYTTLDRPASSNPEIKMFYTPFCKPCAIVHSPIQMMAERAGVKFVDVPVNAGNLGKDIQESIITAQNQGIDKKFVIGLLTNIHDRKGNDPRTREDLAQLLEKCGGNADEFRKGCEEIHKQAEELDQLVNEYYVSATPTIVINGNKQIALHTLKSFSELEQLLNHLLEV